MWFSINQLGMTGPLFVLLRGEYHIYGHVDNRLMLTFGTYSISGGALLINQQGTIHLGLTLTGCSSTFELWNHWLVPAKYLYNVPTTAIHYLPNNYLYTV